MEDLDALLADLETTRTQLKENRGKNIQDSPYSYPLGALSPQTPVSPIYSEIANGFSPSPSPSSHPNNHNHSYTVQQVESEPLYQVQDIQLPPSARVYSEPTRGNSFTQQSPTYSLEYTPRTPTSPPLSDHQEGNVAPPKPARSRANGRQPPPTLPKPTLKPTAKPTVFRYDAAATASYQNSTYQPTPAPPRMAAMPVSELDSLLQELEAAQSQIQNSSTPPPKPPPPAAGMVKPPRTNMVGGGGGGGGGGVSDLNDMLDDLVGTVTPASYSVETTTKTYTTHSQPPQVAPTQQSAPPPSSQQQQPIGRVMVNNTHAPPPGPGGQPQISQPPLRTASSATKELDDLMASLSDFQLSPTDPVTQEPAYAQPHKVTPPPKPAHPPPNMVNINNTPAPPAAGGQQYPSQQPGGAPPQQNYTPSQPSQLDSMLGHLNSDVSRQGVQTMAKGMCAACQKPIAGQVVTALGQTWHSEHFVCAKCQKELGTQTFFERDGQAYCEEDYHNLFAPKCAYCHGPITDRCVTALDKTWHPEHFFCAQCGKTFGEDGFHEKNGRAYCRDDYFDMFAPRCGGCNMAIMDNFITALNAQWHPECFVCAECRQSFNEGNFFDHDGVPYCEIHYHAVRGSLCYGCNKPITGRCITAMHRKFHPEHFVCDYCLKQLNKGTFKEQNGKAYCHPCFVKLFN